MNGIGALLDLYRGPAVVAGIVFLRVGAAMAMMPGFGERMMPARLRLALALAFTAIVAPAVGADLSGLVTGQGSAVFLLASETLIGLALGLSLRACVLALEMAGALVASSSSLSQMFGGGGEPAPAAGHLLLIGGIAVAMIFGLPTRIAGALILSYDALPAGIIPDAGLMRTWGMAQVVRSFALAFSLAAPFAIAALVYNVALGLISRAMPALMVTFIAAPALTAGALVLLAATAPLMLKIWAEALSVVLADPFSVPR